MRKLLLICLFFTLGKKVNAQYLKYEPTPHLSTRPASSDLIYELNCTAIPTSTNDDARNWFSARMLNKKFYIVIKATQANLALPTDLNGENVFSFTMNSLGAFTSRSISDSGIKTQMSLSSKQDHAGNTYFMLMFITTQPSKPSDPLYVVALRLEPTGRTVDAND